jgi:hypothetical protein
MRLLAPLTSDVEKGKKKTEEENWQITGLIKSKL